MRVADVFTGGAPVNTDRDDGHGGRWHREPEGHGRWGDHHQHWDRNRGWRDDDDRGNRHW